MSRLFGDASASALRSLAHALQTGQLGLPISKLAVSRVVSCHDSVVGDLQRLTDEGMSQEHLALLLECAAQASEARMGGVAPVELVWTGPESSVSHSRDTMAVVHELFAAAERQVTVSTFVVRQAASVFEPLARRMEERTELAVRIFLHVARAWKDARHESEILREFSTGLLADWQGARLPEVYYDPRSVHIDATQRATWHAKCVLVDDDIAFVTSANFTEWAQPRNVEAGVVVRDRHFARQLRAQFDLLIQSKQVRRLPGF